MQQLLACNYTRSLFAVADNAAEDREQSVRQRISRLRPRRLVSEDTPLLSVDRFRTTLQSFLAVLRIAKAALQMSRDVLVVLVPFRSDYPSAGFQIRSNAFQIFSDFYCLICSSAVTSTSADNLFCCTMHTGAVEFDPQLTLRRRDDNGRSCTIRQPGGVGVSENANPAISANRSRRSLPILLQD